jgi:preprotein translocase subunit SecA
MGNKRKRKRIKQIPDQYFASGPFEFARFGKNVVGRSRATPEQHAAIQAKMAAHLPKVVAEIDKLVAKIAGQVSQLPPDRLLHRAWWDFAATVIGTEDKPTGDRDRSMVLHLVDYVQNVIASVSPIIPYKPELTEEEWKALAGDIQTLFTRLSLEYQMCLTAHLSSQDPNLDMKLEEFRFKAEVFWMNVRGKRYQPHERQALIEILAPHSEVLTRLFGIDAPSLVAELDKILVKATSGLQETFTDIKKLQGETCDRMLQMAEEQDVNDPVALIDSLFEEPDLEALRNKVCGEMFGLDLYDVEKNTNIPRNLLDELAWSPGEENEFFAPGEFSGWPLRVWPSMKRPFLRLNGRILCFDIFALFDNFYRIIQRIIWRLEPDYKQTWTLRQKIVSEELPLSYFERLLPGATVYRSARYQWKTSGKPPEWPETDGLIIYDDHLFIIEVKAGAFTYTSPATDLPAHIASLNNLIREPAVSQGSRFVDYLESADEVTIADSEGNEVARLCRSDFRHVTVCAITLDALTEHAARAQRLRSVGVDVGQRSVWALSIDDLRVYADLFDNPLVFLHFVEQRMRAAQSELVDLNDEMEHLGLYSEQNNYGLYATELAGSKKARLSFDGYKTPVDNYYAAVVQGDKPILPRQNMPARYAELIEFLGVAQKPGCSLLASFLLDAAGDYRETIASTIEQQLLDNVRLGRVRPVSTNGEHSFTLCTWTPPVPRDAILALEHTRAVVAAQGEKTRLLVELEYSDEGTLLDIHWQYISLAGLSETALARAHQAGMLLRQKRLVAARTQGKIRVNDPCPCGSGKKYKRCCRP